MSNAPNRPLTTVETVEEDDVAQSPIIPVHLDLHYRVAQEVEASNRISDRVPTPFHATDTNVDETPPPFQLTRHNAADIPSPSPLEPIASSENLSLIQNPIRTDNNQTLSSLGTLSLSPQPEGNETSAPDRKESPIPAHMLSPRR